MNDDDNQQLIKNDPVAPIVDDDGEESISGDTPATTSDDDVDDAMAQVGLTHDDMNGPHELNIAKDIDDAEEYQRTH